MTTAIQKSEATFTASQVDLIKRTVAKGASDDELKMFLHVAQKAGMDPLQKQIHFVKRRYKDEDGKWQETISIQAGIEGVQSRAAREPDYEGTLAAVVYSKDEFVFDHKSGVVKTHECNPFGDRGQIVGAWAVTHRKGKLPFVALVRFSQYVDTRSHFWRNKPDIMIEKVARFTSLKRAYPDVLSGINEPAEMGQASLHAAEAEVEVEPAEPSPEREVGALPAASRATQAPPPVPTPQATPEKAPAARQGAPDPVRKALPIPARRQLLWVAYQGLGYGKDGLPSFVAGVLGEARPSNQWTAEDLDKLEARVQAIAAERADKAKAAALAEEQERRMREQEEDAQQDVPF
jgi:phage recombination protein Bet